MNIRNDASMKYYDGVLNNYIDVSNFKTLLKYQTQQVIMYL
jgi:hypothetical protein